MRLRSWAEQLRRVTGVGLTPEAVLDRASNNLHVSGNCNDENYSLQLLLLLMHDLSLAPFP